MRQIPGDDGRIGSSASFQTCREDFRFTPSTGHIAASHQVTRGAKTDIRTAAMRTFTGIERRFDFLGYSDNCNRCQIA